MTREIRKGIYSCGVQDKELKVFDIIMQTEFGTTYNSYLVTGSEKTALIETAKESFCDEYIKNIEEICSVGKIDYIVMDHTEPDHTGSAARLLELNPKIEVVGTNTALTFLKEIVNGEFKSRAVKNGDSLELGGKTLTFHVLPNLHWPDSMYTFIPEDATLFTCDSFGAHYSFDGLLRSEVQDEEGYARALKYYFDCIMGPFRPFMQKGIAKAKELAPELICPGHGPILDSRIPELMEKYTAWCAPAAAKQKKTVVISYVSAYGYTGMMAEKIAEGVRAAGAEAELFELVHDGCSDIDEKLAGADGLMFGSPTILGDALKPVYDLISTMLPTTHGGKHAAAFGSYGWSGEAVKNLASRLESLRLKTEEGLRVRFKPSQEELEHCFEFGRAFAEKL